MAGRVVRDASRATRDGFRRLFSGGLSGFGPVLPILVWSLSVLVIPAVVCLPGGASIGAAAARAEEPAARLTPIPSATSEQQPRVDPMRAPRLTGSERERLYAEAARDAVQFEQQARQLRRLTELLRPTVVHINTTKPLLRPRNGKASEEDSGSGVIAEVGGRTVVITNRHVVHRAELDNIDIRLDDGRELTPRRLWSDKGTDIAVLEISGDDLQPARLAERHPVQIGDSVLAIGSPFGLAHSVTLGIVSATGRRDLQMGTDGAVQFQDFIQTDAAINPGNSGGPLVNMRGEVVGLNTAIASGSGFNEGIGFAIPISMVMFVVRQLVENGTVARGFLGVTLDKELSPENAARLGMLRPVGARVLQVTRGAPADLAGIQVDDVILEYDGTAVQDDDHLVSLVSVTSVDRAVEIVIFRSGKRIPLRMQVANRGDFE
jgi:serine protease Do